MRKVQIQNMEHDASERDLVIIEQKDGKAAAHMVKPGRALLMQIEPKAFLAIGDHIPVGLLDAEQPKADPTPPPSPEDIAIQERNTAWLAAGEALGWPAPWIERFRQITGQGAAGGAPAIEPNLIAEEPAKTASKSKKAKG